MPVRLSGSTSGYTELAAPAVAGNNSLVLPTGNGAADQALVTNGSGALSWSDRGRMTLATAKASTSGTSIDFSPADGTGIPSWVKRVTVMFSGVSTNGSSSPMVQLGTSAGVATTGYLGSSSVQASGAAAVLIPTNGFIVVTSTYGSSASILYGHVTCSLITGNTWIVSGVTGRSDSAQTYVLGGQVALSGTLDRIRITTVSGTDAFDAGSINILYEG